MTDVEMLQRHAMLWPTGTPTRVRVDKIAARYERMEKALKEIAEKHKHGDTWCVGLAREALKI